MMRALSALDMLYNPEYRPDIPERDAAQGSDGRTRSRGRNVGEIGRSLQNKARALIGTITAPNPETDEMLARIIAAETAAAMQNNPDTNASDWYSKNVEAAVQSVANLYPEVATDPRHRSAFALSLALTSQGIKVSRNADIGLAAYEFWRDNGRFPVFGEGTASRAIRSNFRLANQLIKAFDKEGANFTFEDFLTQQYTKKELLNALDDAGIPTGKGGVTLSGENVTATLYGSAVFGPKIGQGFYQNLMGNFDPITIDKWFMRTWGRLTGVLVGKPKLQENVQNLAAAMRAEGIEFDPELYGSDEQYTLDTITRVFDMGEKFYTDNREAIEAGETQKSPAMREAARAVTNGLFTIDSPLAVHSVSGFARSSDALVRFLQRTESTCRRQTFRRLFGTPKKICTPFFVTVVRRCGLTSPMKTHMRSYSMAKQGYAPWTEEADLTMSDELSEQQTERLAQALARLAVRKHQSGSQQETTEQRRG